MERPLSSGTIRTHHHAHRTSRGATSLIMSMTLPDLRGLPHMSVSQLKAFLQCPRKYRFHYIDRIEPEFRPVALAFGTAWHETIGAHLLPQVQGQYLSRAELQALFRDSLNEQVNEEGPPVLFEDEEDLGKCVDLGLRMLDAFFLRVPRPDQVLEVERAFVLELAHPVTGEIAPVPLIGAIDAIVVDEGKTEIWELKTGKKKWSADQLEYDAQPTAYVMAARELGHEDARVKLLVTTKAKQPDVQIERLVRRRGDEREFAETVLDVLHAVKAGVDVRTRGWGCRSCAFANVCGV
jgi:putative RecB family exonuclease